jgi:hypothetical protein
LHVLHLPAGVAPAALSVAAPHLVFGYPRDYSAPDGELDFQSTAYRTLAEFDRYPLVRLFLSVQRIVGLLVDAALGNTPLA